MESFKLPIVPLTTEIGNPKASKALPFRKS